MIPGRHRLCIEERPVVRLPVAHDAVVVGHIVVERQITCRGLWGIIGLSGIVVWMKGGGAHRSLGLAPGMTC